MYKDEIVWGELYIMKYVNIIQLCFYLSLDIICKMSNWVLKRVKCIRGYDIMWAWYILKGNTKSDAINEMCLAFEQSS